MTIKTVGELRKIIKDLDDDFNIELRIRQKLSDEELKNMPYPYPYKSTYTNLEFDDIGYSDKDFCLGCELKDVSLNKQNGKEKIDFYERQIQGLILILEQNDKEDYMITRKYVIEKLNMILNGGIGFSPYILEKLE